MKKLLMVTFCASLVLGVMAQEKKDEIPAAAKSAFAAKFPGAQKVKWDIEKPGEFEAEFKLNGSEMSVLYDANGTLLETEVEIKESELPQGAKETLAKDFPGYKLDEIEKATDAKGVVTYEMEAKKSKAEYELVLDNAGKVLKKEEKKKEKDEKDKD